MRIVIPFRMPRAGLEVLRSRGYYVDVYLDRVAPREWIEEKIVEADAVIVSPAIDLDREVLRRARRLRIVALFGSGYERIDIDACEEMGVCVARVSRYVDESTAELALALALTILRHIVDGDKLVRSGMWKEIAPREMLGRSVKECVVGIVGMGRLGTNVAKLFRALGAKVVYWSRRRKPLLEDALGVEYLDLDTLLSTSDVIGICLAATKETKSFLNYEKLSKLRDGAVLINVSRGSVIDEEALIRLLRERNIYAALDVYQEEPLPPNHPLTSLRNVVLTPHVGGYTRRAMKLTALDVAHMVIEYLERGVLTRGEALNRACATPR